MLTQKAKTEWQSVETEKVSARGRRLGWRVCITNGIAELIRSTINRVNGNKGRQEMVNDPQDMGENSDVEKTDKRQSQKQKQKDSSQ